MPFGGCSPEQPKKSALRRSALRETPKREIRLENKTCIPRPSQIETIIRLCQRWSRRGSLSSAVTVLSHLTAASFTLCFSKSLDLKEFDTPP